MDQEEKREIFMIGPSKDMRGGIASVIRAYERSGFFERNGVRFLPSVHSGRRISKLAKMIYAFIGIAGVLSRAKPTIVHLHIASGFSLWRKLGYVLLSRILGHKVLLQFHSGKLASYLSGLSHRRRRLVIGILRLGHGHLVVSREIEAALRDFGLDGPMGLVKNPIVYEKRTSSALEHALLPDPFHNCRYALFVGRLEEEKGIWELLEAWGDINRKFLDVVLVLAGEGANQQAHTYARLNGFGGRVCFLGWVPDVLSLIDGAEVVVVPSHFEGQPIVILEAMACGKAILATRVGEIPNMLSDQKSGYLVPARSAKELSVALESLLRSSALRCQLGREARVRYEHEFSEIRAEETLLCAYRQVI